MAVINHVGRLKKNRRKVVVAYKTVPGESDNCIVITTENLMGDEHDSLMKTLESDTGQNAFEFAEAMSRTTLPNGQNMLYGFHQAGRMIKMPTNEVEMIPERNSVILLSELNEQIAKQKGVSVDDLSLGNNEEKNKSSQQEQTQSNEDSEVFSGEHYSSENTNNEEVLTDEELASKYRSQADYMFKEAKRLKKEADELDPKKKNSQSEEEKEPKE